MDLSSVKIFSGVPYLQTGELYAISSQQQQERI